MALRPRRPRPPRRTAATAAARLTGTRDRAPRPRPRSRTAPRGIIGPWPETARPRSRWSSRASASTCGPGATCCCSRRSGSGGSCPSGSARGRPRRSRCASRGSRRSGPLTHDLFATTLGELGVRVERVVIASLADETFHARLGPGNGGQPPRDRRPAVRRDRPGGPARVPDLRLRRRSWTRRRRMPGRRPRTRTRRATARSGEGKRPGGSTRRLARGDRRGARPDEARHLPRVREQPRPGRPARRAAGLERGGSSG